MNETTKALHKEVDRVLTPTVNTDEMVQAQLTKLRAVAKTLAHAIVDIVPDGIEHDQAVLAVRQAVSYAELGAAVRQATGPPRITAARVSESEAVAIRDKQARG